jgi:hypothetical protein
VPHKPPASRRPILRWWVAPRGHPCLQLLRGLSEFRRDFAQEFGAAPLCFRSDFVFQVTPQAREFLINTAAEFFKFVHRRFAGTLSPIPVL